MTEKHTAAFSALRAEFPHTRNLIYFNSASYGPYSTRVQNALVACIGDRVRSEEDSTAGIFGTREHLRKEYGALIGAKPAQIGIGLNTSYGLNVAAFGLPLRKGDEILVSDIEFPAVIYAFRAAAQTRGLKLRFVPSKDRRFDIDALRKTITKRSRVLAISWVQFFNGYKNDLVALGEICREHGLYFVVDGIQGTGMEPIDVRKLGIDIYSTGCQKWLLAPQGCGFFYVADSIRDQLQLPFASWLGVEWHQKFGDLFKYQLDFVENVSRFELGYYVELNLVGMRQAVSMFRELGVRNIQRHTHSLIDRLADYIRSNRYYRITSSMEPKHRSAIFTFTCEDYRGLHRELYRNKIVCVHREGSVRISVHLFNNEEDIDKLIRILDRFAESAQ